MTSNEANEILSKMDVLTAEVREVREMFEGVEGYARFIKRNHPRRR